MRNLKVYRFICHRQFQKTPKDIKKNQMIRVFQLATLLDKRRFLAALRMTFYVTLNEVKGLLCAISEKLVK